MVLEEIAEKELEVAYNNLDIKLDLTSLSTFTVTICM